MANMRVRIVDTATKPVIIVDRVGGTLSEENGIPASFPAGFQPADSAVILMFADEVDLDEAEVTARVAGRVPAGELRRPDTAGQRHPHEDLGTEAMPQ